jgi:peptidoglycan hydrolase CwlO-like protein
MRQKSLNMQKQFIGLLLIAIAFTLYSCSAKTDAKANSNSELTEKKTKLEELKKQQDALTKQIADLQAEIIKLDPSANPEKAKLVAVQKLSDSGFHALYKPPGESRCSEYSLRNTTRTRRPG